MTELSILSSYHPIQYIPSLMIKEKNEWFLGSSRGWYGMVWPQNPWVGCSDDWYDHWGVRGGWPVSFVTFWGHWGLKTPQHYFIRDKIAEISIYSTSSVTTLSTTLVRTFRATPVSELVSAEWVYIPRHLTLLSIWRNSWDIHLLHHLSHHLVHHLGEDVQGDASVIVGLSRESTYI